MYNLSICSHGIYQLKKIKNEYINAIYMHIYN